MKRQIFRLENKDSVGPFEFARAKGADTIVELLDRLEYTYGLREVLPWNKSSGGVQPTEDHPHHDTDTEAPDWFDDHVWMVGTKSEEQLLFWFPTSSFEFFAKWGFRLVVYECECDFIHFGEAQVLFCVDQAIVIERRLLS